MKLRDKFKQIDNRYIRPCLIREHKAHEPKILETYSKLTMKDAIDYMRRNTSVLANGSGSDSLAVLFRNYTANNMNSSASIAHMDQGWNLDIGELEYSPSARDLSDAKVHHLLSEELWKPYRRVGYFCLEKLVGKPWKPLENPQNYSKNPQNHSKTWENFKNHWKTGKSCCFY